MEYNEFLNYLTENLNREFSPEADISSHRIMKNNGVYLDALSLCNHESNISAMVYTNEYFLEFKNGRSLDDILKEITQILRNNYKSSPDMTFLNNFSQIKSRIAVKLINYASNAALLENVPHKKFLDLAIIFYIVIQHMPFGNASIIINNRHIELWDVDREELYELACSNTLRLLGCEIKDMNSIIKEFLIEDLRHLSDEYCRRNVLNTAPDINQFADSIITGLHTGIDERPMFVLTNRERFLGASCMLFTGILKSFAMQQQSDLYILPSSIHEVILIPVSKSPSKEELCSMVEEINRTEVAAVDVLSDNVYTYSLSDNRIYL